MCVIGWCLEESLGREQIGLVFFAGRASDPLERSPMKQAILTLSILILMCSTLLVHAQQPYQYIRADIPFDFQVGGNTLPPGTYDFCWNRKFVAAVKLADMSARSEHPIQYVTISAVENPTKNTEPIVVFHRMGNLYFLSEIHQPGDGIVTVMPSARERSMKKLATTKVEVHGESGK